MRKSYKSVRKVKQYFDGKGWSTKAFNEQPNYLAGLFTHAYENILYLQYRCPLCGDDVTVSKPIDHNPISYEAHVAGEMVNNLRRELSKHYEYECGSNRERRLKTAEILIDKFSDRIYG